MKEISQTEIRKFITESDIAELRNYGVIKPIGNGEVSGFLIDITKLYNYSVEKHKSMLMPQAIRFYKLCYYLDPCYLNGELCLKLFKNYVFMADWNEAIEYLRTMLNNNLGTDQTNNMFYLLLMSYITELPEDLKEKAKNIKKEDLIWVNANDDFANSMNAMRKCILTSSAIEAVRLIDQMEERFGDYLYGKIQIMKKLVIAAKEVEEERNEMFIGALVDKHYSLAYEIYLYGLDQRPERKKDERFKQLLKALINMREKNKKPRTETTQKENIYKVIGIGDYGRALWLITNQYNGIEEEMEKDPLYVLLYHVVCELERLEWSNNNYVLYFQPYNDPSQNG